MSHLLSSATSMVKYWWVSLLVGALAIAWGIYSLVNPDYTLQVARLLFVLTFLFGGMLQIGTSIAAREVMRGWGWTLFSGIVDLLFGILLLMAPVLSLVVLLLYVGFWVMFQSIWGISAAINLQKMGAPDWGWLLAWAILGLLLSLVLIAKPVFAAGVVVYMLGFALLVYGVFRIHIAFRLRKIGTNVGKLRKFVEDFEHKIDTQH